MDTAFLHGKLDCSPFLPRSAMHKRGLCCRAMSVRLSVCPSATFMYSVETNNRIFIFSCHRATTPLYFLYQTLWQSSDGVPQNWGRISVFDQYLALASITDGPSRVVNSLAVEYKLQSLCVSRLP